MKNKLNKNQEALDTLISKTDRVNDTCARLGTCIKNGKCSIKRFGIIGCKDYEIAMTLQYLVDKATPKKAKLDYVATVFEKMCGEQNIYVCPICKGINERNEVYHCWCCGQALDWDKE